MESVKLQPAQKRVLFGLQAAQRSQAKVFPFLNRQAAPQDVFTRRTHFGSETLLAEPYTLREATLADVPEIIDFIASMRQTAFKVPPNPVHLQERRALLEAGIKHPQGKTVILRRNDDNQIIGSASLIPAECLTGRKSRTTIYANAYVTPDLRGNGIGRKMLDGFVHFAQQQGFRHIVAYTLNQRFSDYLGHHLGFRHDWSQLPDRKQIMKKLEAKYTTEEFTRMIWLDKKLDASRLPLETTNTFGEKGETSAKNPNEGDNHHRGLDGKLITWIA